MSQTERRIFSADSLERAVLEAAGHYGVEPDALRYEEIEKKSGFTRRRRVAIRVDPERLTREAEAAEADDTRTEDDPVESADVVAASDQGAAVEDGEGEVSEDEPDETPAKPMIEDRKAESKAPARSHSARGELRGLARRRADLVGALAEPGPEVLESAERWLSRILDLADLSLESTIRQGPEQLEVELSGEDADWLVEDEGEALQAIQLLLPRLMLSDLGEAPACRVDCNGFQEAREERLRVRAHRAAAEVRRSGERSVLEPMMPADRRTVHLTLVHDGTVTTESVGRGFFKRVTIRPN